MRNNPTEGLYKRLKKEFIDLGETARKKLTGGKVVYATINRKVQGQLFTPTVRPNTYTQMDLQQNILTGSLT